MKYVGLLALAKITRTHADLVFEHHEIILSCIDDADISIRLRALDLIVGMVSRETLIDVVKQLILQLLEPPPDSTAPHLPDYYRAELVRRILAMSTKDNYANIGNNFEWYVAVLVDLARIAKVDVGKGLAEEYMNVTIRVKSVRSFSVKVLGDLLRDFDVMSGGTEKMQGQSAVLGAAAWIVGEYVRYFFSLSLLTEVFLNTPRRRWKHYCLHMQRGSRCKFRRCTSKLCRRHSRHGQLKPLQVGHKIARSKWSS